MDEHPTTRVPDLRRPWLLDAYVVSVVVPAVVVIGLIAREGIHVEPSVRSAFGVFAVLFVIGEMNTIKWIRLDEGGEVTTTWAYAFGMMLLGSAGATLAVVASACAISDLVDRKPASRLIFNVSQLCLSLAAAHGILAAFGHEGTLAARGDLPASWFVAILLAGAVCFLGNGTLTCIALALHERTSIVSMLRRGMFANLTTDGAMLALAPCFVVVSQRSLMLLPLGLVTAGLVYRSSRSALTNEHAANHDPLTELLNRRAFDARLDEWTSSTQGKHRFGALLLMDLNGFKGINDRLGHHVGDLVLQEVARRLNEGRRQGQLVARLGGDEFAILLTRVVDPAEALARAWDIHRLLTERPMTIGYPVDVGVSIGVAVFPEHGDDPTSLQRHADIAMYIAKRGKLGVARFEPDDNNGHHGRITLVEGLGAGLDRGELVLHYQPQIELATGAVRGVEALVRWQHPTLGLVPPAEFVPLAEQTELIHPLTAFVLEQALLHCREWTLQGLDLTVAVNISAANLRDRRFPEVVASLLASTQVEPWRLELELTENTVIGEAALPIDVLRRLRALGVQLSIDDFGTGYSPLAALTNLPVHGIKIDRTFVKELGRPGNDHIVQALLGLADGFDLSVVAEGVEDRAAYDRLAELGCTYAQGFYISRPLPHIEVARWVKKHHGERLRRAS